MANRAKGQTKPRKPRRAPAAAAPAAEALTAKLSTSTLALSLEILERQQINVGQPDFETTAVRVIQARSELKAALQERGIKVE